MIAPPRRWKRHQGRIDAAFVPDGPVNGETCRAYVANSAGPRPGDPAGSKGDP